MSENLTQPPPKPGAEDVTVAVIEWLHERRERGIAKYGTTLQTFNGRDPVADAMEEHLDALQYLGQWRMERRALMEQVATARALIARFLVLMPDRHGDCGTACAGCEAARFNGEGR